MNSCGMVVTYMSRQDWKGQKFWIKLRTMFFNLCLFIYQMVLMVVGTAYGKIKWEKYYYDLRGIIPLWSLAILTWFIPKWMAILVGVVMIFIAVAMLRHIPWRRVWRAAQASHVRLCLGEIKPKWIGMETKKLKYPEETISVLKFSERRWQYINFGYPEAKIEKYWHPGLCNGNRFRYYDPTFEPSPNFIAAMIEYANKQVGKGYDDFQLISNGLHLIAWIVWPWCWGKELKVIKAFNRPGGREHCISGVTACLRWADWKRGGLLIGRGNSNFFNDYDTATTSPCLVPLSKNWEEVKE